MGADVHLLVFALAELSAILPTAGGGYGFARRALGPWGGFLTGTAILIEYVLAPAAISIFIGDYVESLGLFGLESGWPVYLACFAIFIGIHLWGVGEALRFSLVVTAIAVAALLIFAVGALHRLPRRASLDDIPVDTYAVRLQLLAAVRPARHLGGVPLRHVVLPRRRGRAAGGRGDQGPGALAAARRIAVVDGHPGGAGRCSPSSPRPGARGSGADPGRRATRWSRRSSRTASPTTLSRFVNYAGLAGLVASFFSLIYAGSRQLFALSRAGYLPRFLSLTSRRKAPYLGLLVPGAIGFALAARYGQRRPDAEHRGLRRHHLATR